MVLVYFFRFVRFFLFFRSDSQFLSKRNPVLFDLMNSRNLDILLARMESRKRELSQDEMIKKIDRAMKIVRATTGYGMTWSEQVAAFCELGNAKFLAKFLSRCPPAPPPAPGFDENDNTLEWTKLGVIVKGPFNTVDELYEKAIRPKFEELLLKDQNTDAGAELQKLGRGLTRIYYELNIVRRGPTSSEGDTPAVAEEKPRGKFKIDFTKAKVDKGRAERLEQLYELWHGRGAGGVALGDSFPDLPTKNHPAPETGVKGEVEVEVVAYYLGTRTIFSQYNAECSYVIGQTAIYVVHTNIGEPYVKVSKKGKPSISREDGLW